MASETVNVENRSRARTSNTNKRKSVMKSSLMNTVCSAIEVFTAEKTASLFTALQMDFGELRSLFPVKDAPTSRVIKRTTLREERASWFQYKKKAKENGEKTKDIGWTAIRRKWKNELKKVEGEKALKSRSPEYIAQRGLAEERKKQFACGINQVLRLCEKDNAKEFLEAVLVDDNVSKFLSSPLYTACHAKGILVARVKSLSEKLQHHFGFPVACVGIKSTNSSSRCFHNIRSFIQTVPEYNNNAETESARKSTKLDEEPTQNGGTV